MLSLGEILKLSHQQQSPKRIRLSPGKGSASPAVVAYTPARPDTASEEAAAPKTSQGAAEAGQHRKASQALVAASQRIVTRRPPAQGREKLHAAYPPHPTSAAGQCPSLLPPSLISLCPGTPAKSCAAARQPGRRKECRASPALTPLGRAQEAGQVPTGGPDPTWSWAGGRQGDGEEMTGASQQGTGGSRRGAGRGAIAESRGVRRRAAGWPSEPKRRRSRPAKLTVQPAPRTRGRRREQLAFRGRGGASSSSPLSGDNSPPQRRHGRSKRPATALRLFLGWSERAAATVLLTPSEPQPAPPPVRTALNLPTASSQLRLSETPTRAAFASQRGFCFVPSPPRRSRSRGSGLRAGPCCGRLRAIPSRWAAPPDPDGRPLRFPGIVLAEKQEVGRRRRSACLARLPRVPSDVTSRKLCWGTQVVLCLASTPMRCWVPVARREDAPLPPPAQ